jgi:hypothetical protein
VFFWPGPIIHEAGKGYALRPIPGKITIPSRVISNNIRLSALLSHPIFPEDEFRLTDDWRFSFRFEIDETAPEAIPLGIEAHIVWKLYADDMPPQTGKVSISDLVRI